ncbi:MAG: hypothetical protein ACI9IV_001794, partial [Paracoccaceae bacterium]
DMLSGGKLPSDLHLRLLRKISILKDKFAPLGGVELTTN